MEKTTLGVGTVRRAWFLQISLVLVMVALLVLGVVLDKHNAQGVENWLMRLSLVVVGLSIAADYLNRAFGVFTGFNSNMWGYLEQSALSVSFGSITALFAVAGTVLSGFADLIQ